MLGLGNSIVTGGATSEWTPASASGLQLWLKSGTGVLSNQNAAGTAFDPIRSSALGNLTNTNRIHQWNDQSGNDNHATQGTGNQMPKWDATLDSQAWANKWMDLSTNITFAADEDFSIAMRFSIDDVSQNVSFFGHDASNLLKLQGASGAGDFRFLDGDSSAKAFAEATAVLVNDDIYTLVFTRSGGSDGTLNLFMNKDGVFDDKDWDAAESHTETSSHTISNIGASADNTLEMDGVIYDVLIYKGYALNASDRTELYSYLANQTQEQG